jgi:hypothetical protein
VLRLLLRDGLEWWVGDVVGLCEVCLVLGLGQWVDMDDGDPSELGS